MPRKHKNTTTQTHCRNGHEYTPENTSYRNRLFNGNVTTYKQCVTCRDVANANASANYEAKLKTAEKYQRKPFIHKIPPGNRNNHLYAFAVYTCRIYGFGNKAFRLIEEENIRSFTEPLPKQEVEQVFNSVRAQQSRGEAFDRV